MSNFDLIFCKVYIYRKSSISSRPCIFLDPKFYRLVLESFQNALSKVQFFLHQEFTGNQAIFEKKLKFGHLQGEQESLLSDF